MDCTLEYFLLFCDEMLQNYFVKNTVINFYAYPVNLPSRLLFSECLLISEVHSIMGGVFVFVI